MNPDPHPFKTRPHRTLLGLSVPVLFSLIAEPITGLVDTAFTARLGSAPLAALGVGTVALSSFFWIFNFLGISTQTQAAQSAGGSSETSAGATTALGIAVAALIGVAIAILVWPFASVISQAMGATGEVLLESDRYIRARLVGAPAVLVTLVAFGSLRGLQDMKTPLWIAVGLNVVNVALDPLLIFGAGPIPALGVSGAGLASSISQWIGAGFVLAAIRKRFGRSQSIPWGQARRLFTVGFDLFVRTGMLSLFLIMATRTATSIGDESGAAHQAVRQVWIFSALAMDAFALSGQSLVGFFFGASDKTEMKRVARYTCQWSFGTGCLLALAMIASQGLVESLLVPASALAVFGPAWLVSALAQPVNSLSFATDGIHWGTGDFRYLRNAITVATLVGGLALFAIDIQSPDALTHVWLITGAWICIRAALGLVRIWPGIGDSPYRV